jgi:K+-sensing histidine kinase KdpD
MDARLAAVVVHDLKNALGILEGELQAMTIRPTVEQATQAHGNCAALRNKLIGFLTLYKADTQGLRAQIEALNPADFLNALVRDRLTDKPHLQIQLNEADMPVLAFFDENLVGLALEAALQNATRFARSSINVDCRQEHSGEIVFSIHDDGGGLGTQEEKASTGLGMELCAAIAQAHTKGDKKGSVSLRDHPDGGALFELKLP